MSKNKIGLEGFLTCEVVSLKMNNREIKTKDKMYYHFKASDVKYAIEINDMLYIYLENGIDLVIEKNSLQ